MRVEMSVEHGIQLLLQALSDFFIEVILAVEVVKHQIDEQLIGYLYAFHSILSLPFRDGCDDCDGIFDTAPAVILIVTTVTNRHTALRVRLMKLPFRVRFTEYSIPYSFSNSPALTLSRRVKMLG